MDLQKFRKVTPLKPAAAWIGGKSQLAERIIARIERIPHRAYVEPFVGMGGIFLRRRLAPAAEVINDLSGDVANFFRILQHHYVPFMDLLRYRFTSREEFGRLLAQDPETLTDLHRAVRFLYLQRASFGGKVAGRTFGVSPQLPGRFDVTKLEPRLAEIAERLAAVVIENLPYADLILAYDRPGTLFYLDPPYWGAEGYYGKGMFGRGDFAALAEQLAGLKGVFVLSINDTAEIRKIFGSFDLEEVDLTYTIDGNDNAKVARELIVTQKDLPMRPEPQPLLFD
ncbi:DNA adenine methylase [Methylovirgula sp. 4M-Z18]|uniref:DNA adenine methylase n=1 Tax=Methylovirgula sp. 4M-Z18 TaxID=2293567 RepID=UPI000E2F54D5|nr:DNA adenine methylase [Methylovirgula sp. 4M-Z18]RFB80376.1 DNA adenine methylase [Methylovirgula sp. 4M-Z18]